MNQNPSLVVSFQEFSKQLISNIIGIEQADLSWQLPFHVNDLMKSH